MVGNRLPIGGEPVRAGGGPALSRQRHGAAGQAPDHVQRGLKGLDVCRTLRPARGARPSLTGQGISAISPPAAGIGGRASPNAPEQLDGVGFSVAFHLAPLHRQQ